MRISFLYQEFFAEGTGAVAALNLAAGSTWSPPECVQLFNTAAGISILA